MRKLFLFLLLAVPCGAQVQPYVVPIQNPSFETAVPVQYQRDCGAYTYEVPPGWTSATGTVAVVVPATVRPSCDFSNPPDGKQFLLIQAGTVSQNLGDISKMPFADKNGGVDGTFTLHIFVANYFYWYPGQFTVSLSLYCQLGNTLCAGAQGSGNTRVLCPTAGWGAGDFRDITLVCPSQRQYGELILTLGSTGYQMLFDNVSLSFTASN